MHTGSVYYFLKSPWPALNAVQILQYAAFAAYRPITSTPYAPNRHVCVLTPTVSAGFYQVLIERLQSSVSLRELEKDLDALQAGLRGGFMLVVFGVLKRA